MRVIDRPGTALALPRDMSNTGNQGHGVGSEIDTHNHEPLPFGRRVDGCPRCGALKAGTVKAKKGWGASKRAWEAQQLRAIRNHDCKASGCNVVCTFGDW